MGVLRAVTSPLPWCVVVEGSVGWAAWLTLVVFPGEGEDTNSVDAVPEVSHASGASTRRVSSLCEEGLCEGSGLCCVCSPTSVPVAEVT